jgi:hypothetical protein
LSVTSVGAAAVCCTRRRSICRDSGVVDEGQT